MKAGLYLVGTPIGNLQDITLRALEWLKGASLVVAEDTRQTRKLLDRYEIHVPLASCHRFNEASRVDFILGKIREGGAVVLVTDSGMPAISDPGSRVVAACHAAGLPVTCAPGPSAVTTALALSGFGGAAFSFAGFLPRKPGPRRRLLAALCAREEPVVFFESPFRLLRSLEELRELIGPRPIFLGRELTKQFEEGLTGSAAELTAAFAGRAVRGELVLVISPADGRRPVPPEPGECG